MTYSLSSRGILIKSVLRVRRPEVEIDAHLVLGNGEQRTGARLAGGLGFIISPNTLLRRLRQSSQDMKHAPRVIGADDFAFKRGVRAEGMHHRQVRQQPDARMDTQAFAPLVRHSNLGQLPSSSSGARLSLAPGSSHLLHHIRW